MPRTVRYERLRPDELRAELARCPVCYIPFGPIEWHGPQSAMGLDALNAETIALRSAELYGGVVLPTLFVGTESERDEATLARLGFEDTSVHVVGMDFPKNSVKSLYYREETLRLLLRDTARLLLQNGYKLLVFVNAHGASNQLRALSELQLEFDHTLRGAKVLLATPIASADPSLGGGHATAGETSLLLHQHPDLVDLGQLPPTEEPLYVRDYGMADGEYFMGTAGAPFTVLDDPRTKTSAARGQADTDAEIQCLRALVDAEKKKLGIA